MPHGSRRDLQLLGERSFVREVAGADRFDDREESADVAHRRGARAFLLCFPLHVRSGGSFLACLRSKRPPARLIRLEALPTCAWARGSSHTAKQQSETDQVRLFSNK